MDPSISWLQEIQVRTKDKYRLKVQGYKKIFYANENEKKAGVAIHAGHKTDFKTKAVIRDKEHYIIIKRIINNSNDYSRGL